MGDTLQLNLKSDIDWMETLQLNLKSDQMDEQSPATQPKV
jgi:hypothetical protein